MRKVFTKEDIKKSACASLNPHLFDDPAPAKKKAKYRNTKTEVHGIKFDSEKEAKRYQELKFQLKHGLIAFLEMQVRYLLIEANETENKCEYVADFRYRLTDTGALVVEDVKSEITRKLPVYIMKRKLMKSVHGIEIKEV